MDKKVLIVDDSNTNNFLLQSILETEGIKSEIALSGKEVFDFIKVEKPALILLDIMMPYTDGFTVLDKLKNNPNTKEVPVVFITAKHDDNLKERALDAGAIDLIQKPIDVNEVIEIVKQIIVN